MPIAPYQSPTTISPAQVRDIARKARKLLRKGELSSHAYAVLDALLWVGRAPGQVSVTAAYSRIQKLAHVCRATAVKAVKALIGAGLIRKVKSRDLILWFNGGRKWRQRPNIYVLRCESTPRPEYQDQITNIVQIGPSTAEARAAQAALAAIAQRRQASLLGKGWAAPATG